MVNLQGEEVLWFVALEDKYVVKTLLKEIFDQICNFRAAWLTGYWEIDMHWRINLKMW